MKNKQGRKVNVNMKIALLHLLFFFFLSVEHHFQGNFVYLNAANFTSELQQGHSYIRVLKISWTANLKANNISSASRVAGQPSCRGRGNKLLIDLTFFQQFPADRHFLVSWPRAPTFYSATMDIFI